MKQTFWLGLGLLAVVGGSGRLLGAVTAVQFSQSTVIYNLQSVQGVPISTNVDASIGSNGKQPTTNASGPGYPPPTAQPPTMRCCR
jgi:hypothetical protein